MLCMNKKYFFCMTNKYPEFAELTCHLFVPKTPETSIFEVKNILYPKSNKINSPFFPTVPNKRSVVQHPNDLITFNFSKNPKKKFKIDDNQTKIKRNVSNMMKKMVASNQKWRCKNCDLLLDHCYEIDHVIALFNGGTNKIENLAALCPSCHRLKTCREIIQREEQEIN